MNFGDLKDLTAFYLDDLQFGYFTEAQVGRFINNAQYEVQKILIASYENFYLKCQETTLVADQKLYFLPEDFLKVVKLELQLSTAPGDTARLEPITPSQAELVVGSNGPPRSYYIQKDKLRLFPTPDTARTLRLHYVNLVTELTNDSEIPDVPTQYHEMLAILAARDGFVKDGRDMNALLESKLEMYKQMMKSDAQDRTIDVPKRIVVTEDSWYGNF